MTAALARGLALLRPEVTQGTAADALVFWAMVDGLLVPPSSATVAIYSPAGSELVASSAITPDTDAPGRLARSQAWPEATYPLGEDYSAIFTFVVNGITYSERVWFDVVKQRLAVLVSPDDMLGLQPNLLEHVRALGLAGVKSDLRGFAIAGHVHLCNRLRKKKIRPSLVADRRRLAEPALHYALHFVNAALARAPDDLFDKRAAAAWKLAGEVFEALGELKIDRDEDGTVGEEEKAPTVGQPNWSV